MTITQWLRQRIMERVNGTVGGKAESLEYLKEVRWSKEFETYMRNRLLMGYFRYGPFGQKDREHLNIDSAITRLIRYKKDGNLEHLVDVANLCLVEFVDGQHPKRHFGASDDGEHVMVRKEENC